MRASALFILAGVVSATPNLLNDWSKPCTGGSCSYVAGGLGRGSSYAALSLSGPTSALSDITAAAGWQVLGCPAGWSSGAVHVKIRCAGTAAEAARCNALFEEDARDTIVRLPENCGTGPFARLVASVDVTSPGGPTEHAVVLDYNFDQISHSRGTISFSVSSTSSSNAGLGSPQTYRRGRRNALAPRWGISKTIDLPPVSLHRQFTIFQTSISCPAPAGGSGFSADFDVGVEAGVDAQIGFGFNVNGNIFPPKITKFNVFGKLNGSAEAQFDIKASVTGSLQTGNIQLYSVGLPGVNFPGILNVGPQFLVNAQVSANLNIEAQLIAGVKWVWPDVQVNFPPDSGSSSAQTSHVETPFSLSVNPATLSTTGTVGAHLIPRVEVGVNILSGLAKADVYLSLDASASLDLQLDAQATASTTLAAPTETAVETVTTPTDTGLDTVTSPVDTGLDTETTPSDTTVKTSSGKTVKTFTPTATAGSIFAGPSHNAKLQPVNALASRDGSGSISGCAKLDGGIDVYAGAEGSIKPIFDKNISFDIFKTNINIFNTCFGKSSKKRFVKETVRAVRRAEKSSLARRDFVCPNLGLPQLLQVLNL